MNIESARTNMLKQQMRACNILDEHLLTCVQSIPREHFMPDAYQHLAFTDTPIPIGHEQFTMTPFEEGKMLQSLAIQPSDTILEIGTGSGYVTALLATLGKYVYSVDIFSEFITQAKSKLAALNIGNVSLQTADAAHGWDRYAPYDVIVITGSLPFLPMNFRESLAPNGRLFAIIGNAPAMEATLIKHTKSDQWEEYFLFETNITRLLNAPQREHFTF